jgi:hypothetical protein
MLAAVVATASSWNAGTTQQHLQVAALLAILRRWAGGESGVWNSNALKVSAQHHAAVTYLSGHKPSELLLH